MTQDDTVRIELQYDGGREECILAALQDSQWRALEYLVDEAQRGHAAMDAEGVERVWNGIVLGLAGRIERFLATHLAVEEKLRDALERLGRHDKRCGILNGSDCDCGLDEALGTWAGKR